MTSMLNGKRTPGRTPGFPRTGLWQAAALCALLSAPPASAGTIKVRLVATDGGKPRLVSELRFHRTTGDGLVVRDWTGGVQINDTQVFPRVPLQLEAEKEEKDEFLEEVRGATGEAASGKQRLIDPLYEGKDVAPQFLRPSEQTINLADEGEFLVTPGEIRFRIARGAVQTDDPRAKVLRADTLEIECVPLTVTAVSSDEPARRVGFTPSLRWKGRNLLDDTLYERDEYYLAPSVKGSEATFVQLTLYLVPNASRGEKRSSYTLDDAPFDVDGHGVALSKETPRVRQVGPNQLRLLIPGETAASQRRLPVLWQAPERSYYIVPNLGQQLYTGAVPYPQPAGEDRRLYFTANVEISGSRMSTRFSMPADFEAFPARLAVAENKRAGAEPPAVYLFEHHPRVRGDALTVRLTARRGEEDPLKGVEELPVGLSDGTFSGESEWQGIPATFRRERPDGNLWTLALPDAKPGLVTARVVGMFDRALWVELPFVVAPQGATGAVTLLTHRNRVHYEVGETVELHVAARAERPAQAQLALRLRRQDWTSDLAKLPLELGPEARVATRTLSLDTARLAPGLYRVEGQAEGFLVHPVAFSLHDPVEPSDYPSVAITPFTLETPDRRIGLIRHIVGAHPGYTENSVMPLERAVYERSGRLAAVWAELLENDPLLPVPDRTTGLLPVEKALAIGMTHGARLYWQPAEDFGHVPYNAKHTLPIDNARMFRVQQLLVQRARDWANFGGISNHWHAPLYGYWEGSPPIDGHQPRRNRQVALDFSQATGLEIPSAQQTEGLRKSLAGGSGMDQAEAADIIHRNVAWGYWQAAALPKAYRIWHDAMDEIGTGWWLLNQPPSGWASNANAFPLTHHGPLDAVSTYNITDYGRMPMDLIHGVDLSTAGIRDRPKFVHAWTFSRAAALLEGLLGMTRGADGVDTSANDFVSHNADSLFATWDRRQLLEILHRYGGLMRRLQPFKDTAILFSVTQAWGAGDGSHANRVRSLHHDLLRTRRPCRILLEEDLDAGELQGFAAVFLLGMTAPISPARMKCLADFVNGRGVVFKDEDTSGAYPGRSLTLWGKAKPGYPPGDGEFEFVKVWEDYLTRRETLDAALKDVGKPFVFTDSPRHLAGMMTGEEIRLAIVVNDEPVPTAIPGKLRQNHVIPVRAKVWLDEDYVVYDLLDGARLLQTTGSDGRPSVALDFARCEARMLALFPRPVASLRIWHTDRLAAGGSLALSVALLDEARKAFVDPMPCEIRVLDPSGAERWRLTRALTSEEVLSLPTAVNDLPGEWHAWVQDLTAGLTATAAFRVELPPEAPLSSLKPDVLLFDEEAVVRFLSPERKGPVRILLETTQENLKPLADKVAGQVNRRGRACQVVVVQPEDIHDVPLRWELTDRDKALWAKMEAGEVIGRRRGLQTYFDLKQKVDYVLPNSGYTDPGPPYLVFSDVILAGLPGDNRFLDSAQPYAPRQVTASYPGPGRALVQHVWSPFWERFHALTVSAGDSAGLQRGLDRLAELAEVLKPLPPAAPATKERNPRDLATGFARGRPDRRERFAESQKPLPAVADGKTSTALPRFVSERFGSPVRSLSVSPDGGFIAVSAQLYGPNLFVFDRAGKLLWKEHVGINGATAVTITKGGQRVYATCGDRVLCFDGAGRGLWRLAIPPPGVYANLWSPGPTTLIIDPETQDLLLSGRRHVKRVRVKPGTSQAEPLWAYSDVPWCKEALDFYYARSAFLKAMSPDGRLGLVSLFGVVREQLGYLNAYWKPGIAALDFQTGKVLWSCQGLTVNNALALVGAERSVVYDDDGQMTVFDGGGQALRRIPLPEGLEEMELAPDGNTVVLRTAMARDHILRAYGRSMKLLRIDLRTGRVANFGTEGEIRGFAVSPDGQLVAAGTWNSRIYLFRMLGEKVWEKPVTGGSLVRFLPDGSQIVAGSATGEVVWLRAKDGSELRRTDLMPFSHPEGDFVATVKDDDALPELEVLPPADKAATVVERCKSAIDFEPNLLPDGDFEKNGEGWRSERPEIVPRGWSGNALRLLDKPVETASAACKPRSTYLVSYWIRADAPWRENPCDRIRVDVLDETGGAPVYSASMPVAGAWTERLLAFKTPDRPLRARLRFTPVRHKPFAEGQLASLEESAAMLPPETPVLIDHVQWVRAGFRSPNLLRVHTADEILKQGGQGTSAGGDAKARIEIPNPYPAIYAVQFQQPRLSEVTFFDGRIGDQETSWARSNAVGPKPTDDAYHPFRYASLHVSLPKPRPIAAIAVYEDNRGPKVMRTAVHGQRLCEMVATDYAVLVHDAKADRWVPVASVQENLNVFNLFVFEPVMADHIHYFWCGSGDWHIRLAELEAYSAVGSVVEGLDEAEGQPEGKPDTDDPLRLE
jgi:outer membrane protein assembly factor BamB